ncbi:MAG: hypothetical protein HRF50_15925 [Phycisphaerae bacterium]|jgi:endonuclease III
MKGATQCARRVKLLYRSLRAKLGRASRPAQGDPVTQLILGILTRDVQEARARDALERLRACVVDYNELRVIPVIELTDVLGEYPDARRKAEDLSRALNKIFLDEHAVLLDRLKSMSRREAEAYLRRIEGLEPYTIARIQLLGLQQPAFPLDEAMWAYARSQAIVDPRCTLDEAQSFLERQFDADDLPDAVALLRKAAWAEMGAAVRKGEVERILSTPPDRTSRNMLQAVASAAGGSRGSDDLGPAPPPERDGKLEPQSAAADAHDSRRRARRAPVRSAASPAAPARASGTHQPAPERSKAVKPATKPERKPAHSAARRRRPRRATARRG